MENFSEGSLHKWWPRTPCLNALGKHQRKKHLSLLLENCLIPYLSKHMTSLYFDQVSWQALVMQFDHLSPRGRSLQTAPDSQI